MAMTFDNKYDDDKKEDFFEKPGAPEPKQPKQPRLSRHDPKYWLREDSGWDHLTSIFSLRNRALILTGMGLLLLVIIWMLCLWMFGTTTSESVVYGYVENVEKRGKFIKTYEGVLLPYKALHDTTRYYKEDFTFSIPDSKGPILASYQESGKPLKITYKTYSATMPWRGESRRVVERIDTVNPATILPINFDANPAVKPNNNSVPSNQSPDTETSY